MSGLPSTVPAFDFSWSVFLLPVEPFGGGCERGDPRGRRGGRWWAGKARGRRGGRKGEKQVWLRSLEEVGGLQHWLPTSKGTPRGRGTDASSSLSFLPVKWD